MTLKLKVKVTKQYCLWHCPHIPHTILCTSIQQKNLEAPEGDIRSAYPKESKALYLKTKTLHKKKLNLATDIHQIKNNLQDKKFPVQADFNCNVPANRGAVFRDKWAQMTNEAKIKLTQVLLEDLNSRYHQVKVEIQSNLAQLQQMLTITQYDEICLFLSDKYKATAGAALSKASKRLEQRGPRRITQNRQRTFQQARRIQPNTK